MSVRTATVSLTAIAVGLTSMNAMAQHTPAAIFPDLKVDKFALGASDDHALASELEALIMDDTIRETLGTHVSEGAIRAARQAYAQNVFQPIWNTRAAEKFIDNSDTLRAHGLDTLYEPAFIKQVIDQRFEASKSLQRAKADLVLTSMWIDTASAMSGGLRDEGEGVKSLDNKPVRSELVSHILEAGQADPIRSLEVFAPEAPQYKNLKKSLDMYRQFQSESGWKQIRANGKIEPGNHDPRIPAIRQRLREEGFLPEFRGFSLLRRIMEPDVTVYDSFLEAAITDFQAAHGLETDGIIGAGTFAAMNESSASKVQQIKTAMNDWRTFGDMGERYIWTNIPSYTAEAWTGDRRDLQMKTIVGKPYTPTPAFSDQVEYVVTNPNWYVPTSLFKRQKWSKLKADPGYAVRHNYTIYDRASGQRIDPYSVNWSDPGSPERIRMVQSPGSFNALGELKIIFPNQHTVYLHGTPDKHLFENADRAKSSGCIRLERPVDMAAWLSDADADIDTSTMKTTLEAGTRKHMNLSQHVPVHITYMTVTADEDGVPTFHRDIYRHKAAPLMAEGTYQEFEPKERQPNITETTLEAAGGTSILLQ